MARIVFGMNQSLDGYVDHMAFAPSPTLFRHFVEEAQGLFAEASQEYPVNPAVPWSQTLQSWGEFQPDTLDLSRLGELNAEAVRIFDTVGWR